MSIPDEIIEQIRDAADLVSLIGDHVPLKRTGTDWRGPCPFHGGANRNLAVIPKKQMFYCFVCHEGGDIFAFYMKKFGMEYPTAVREVARHVGIAIPERPTGGPDPREPLFTAAAAAAEWYARRLREADDARAARDYAAERGFDLEKAAVLGLGFAPKGPAFLEGMATLGVGLETLLEAGLAVRREDGTPRPRFWNRLLFPIHDLRGRVVAFGGRILGDGEPKYLNSPDSPIFHKGGLLYNLHQAKHAIRKAERAVVVEGYFDVLTLADVGVEEVVAPLGTGLTTDQARLLTRYAKNVVLLYDSDAPGMRASFRAADELLRGGLRVTIATLPPGDDPDTLVRGGGADAVAALLDDAMDVLERKLQLLERKGWLGTLDGRRSALDRLLTTLRAVADPVTRDLYVHRTAEALGVTRESIERETDARRWAGARDAPRAAPRPPEEPMVLSGLELELLRAMLWRPDLRSGIAAQLGDALPGSGATGELLTLLAGAAAEATHDDLLRRAHGDAHRLLVELLGTPWGPPHVDDVVSGALRRLQAQRVDTEIVAVLRQLALVPEDQKEPLIRKMETLTQEKRKLDPSSWNSVIRSGRSRAR